MSGPKLRYQTIEFKEFDIHLRTLKDKMQFSDDLDEAKNLGINDTLWPIFGVVWPAGLVLARMMDEYDFENKSILEVGCGISLSSLVLNKRNAKISVTDYHPEAERFLAENIRLNFDDPIRFFLSDWNEYNPKLGIFDLVIGSDLLYEDTHAILLAKFIGQHTKIGSEAILVLPNRGHQKEFNLEMEKLGFSHTREEVSKNLSKNNRFEGHIYRYTRN